MVIIFQSVHDTLKAENSLKSAAWGFTVRPIPPSIHQGCGLGIEVAAEDLPAVKEFLEGLNLHPLKYVHL